MAVLERKHSKEAERDLARYGEIRAEIRRAQTTYERLLRRARQKALDAVSHPDSAVNRARLAKVGKVSQATIDLELRTARQERTAAS